MDNLLTFIGLMRRAGAVQTGAEASFDACRLRRARLIVTAGDASPNTREAALAAAGESRTPHIALPYTKSALGQAIGTRDCAVFAVCDAGFARALCEKAGQQAPLEALGRRLAREKKKRARAGGRADTSAKRGTK